MFILFHNDGLTSKAFGGVDMETPEQVRAPSAATAAALRAFVTKVSARTDFSAAILFGSRARHSHRPDSDADVAVLLKGTPGQFVHTKFELDDLAYEVLLDTGLRIQPLPVWQSEWEYPEAYSNPDLLKNIAREGIRL